MSQFSDSLKTIRNQSKKTNISSLIKLADFFMVSLDELVGRDWIGR